TRWRCRPTWQRGGRGSRARPCGRACPAAWWSGVGRGSPGRQGGRAVRRRAAGGEHVTRWRTRPLLVIALGASIIIGSCGLPADLQDDTLTIVLTKEILSVTGPLQKIAFAQMVYTATALRGVSRVRFRVAEADGSNEQDVEPPTDTGANQGTLTRSDYGLL